MDATFHDEICEGWFSVYINDLLLRSTTFDDHLDRLERVLSRINAKGWTTSPEKCFFAFAAIRQLGHRVSGLLVDIDDNKVAAVRDWPEPRNVKELRTWLGFTGYFRKFLKNYGEVARPLTRLLGKDVPSLWNALCSAAFKTLKASLLSAPVLGQPEYTKPFELSTDASVLGLGACLEQVQTIENYEGEVVKERTVRVVICYISQQLKKAEEGYSVPQLECLGLVWALEKLHAFLNGSTFTAWVDASAYQVAHGHARSFAPHASLAASYPGVPRTLDNPTSVQNIKRQR